jgi:hypothetical protein
MLYLRNVQVRGFDTIAHFNRSQHALPAPASAGPKGWTTVDEYAHGETPPLLEYKPNRHVPGKGRMLQLEAPIIVDGRRSTADIVRVRGISSSSGVGPDQSADFAKGLREKHSYGDEATFPSFETPGAIDVTAAPYFAKGDGASDDAAAINAALQAAAAARTRAGTTQQQAVVFLPKGVYRLSATVLVPQGVALVGTSHRLVLLVPTRDRSARLNSSEPLIRMLGPSDSAFTAGEIIPGSTLAHMMLGTMQHQRNVVAWCESVRGFSPCARKWEKRSF